MRIVGGRRALFWVLMVGVCGAFIGCKSEDLVHPDAREAYDVLRRAAVEKPLARVNGRELSAEDFEVFWAENSALTREDAVQAWVEQEVVAQHGEKVLGQDDGALAFARKQGMVRVLLREEVEGKVGVEDGKGSELLGKVRDGLRAQMSQPAGVRASHLLVHVPKERVKEGAQAGDPLEKISEEERAGLFELAREWALKLGGELGETASLDDLYAVEQRFAGEIPPTLMLAVNAHLSFAVPAEASDVERPAAGLIPEGWLGVVGEFAAGAAAMIGSEEGTISAPVRSDFGWHLIRFEKEYAAKPADEAEVEERARVEAVRMERARRLGEFSGGLIEASVIHLFPQVLLQESSEGGAAGLNRR